MNQTLFMRGEPGAKYGMYDCQQKRFLHGICEDTPMLAWARLCQMLGDGAKKHRYQPRKLAKKGDAEL